MSPPPAALLSTSLVLMVLMVYSAEGHPAAQSERCLCTGRSLVNEKRILQKSFQTVLQDSVVYRPNMFCSKTEITIGKKCISPKHPLGKFIIEMKDRREPTSG